MTWLALAPATSWATVSPARNGSSPRFSGRRPRQRRARDVHRRAQPPVVALAARLGGDRLAVGARQATVERRRERLRRRERRRAVGADAARASCELSAGTPKLADRRVVAERDLHLLVERERVQQRVRARRGRQ